MFRFEETASGKEISPGNFCFCDKGHAATVTCHPPRYQQTRNHNRYISSQQEAMYSATRYETGPGIAP